MDLDNLITHPKIWRAGSGNQRLECMPTGFAALDRSLPGAGWPRRAITEIFVDRYGIGELGLLMPALVRLEQCSIAWIAPPYVPYAPALARRGIDLNRLLVVHPMTENDAPWALEEIVRAQFQATVLGWLRVASDRILRRLQLIVEAQQAWAILFRPVSMVQQKSPAALKLRLSKQGEQLKIEILKCRGSRPKVIFLADRGGVG